MQRRRRLRASTATRGLLRGGVRSRCTEAAICLALVLSGCGGGEISLTEYVDQINVAAATADDRATQIASEGVLSDDLTPVEVQAGIRRILNEVRVPLQETVDEVEPPEKIVHLHSLLWNWHAEFIQTETALAERFGGTPDTEEGWTALSESPEAAAYRASLAEGKRVCLDFQADLDSTAERGVFKDVPWLPDELSEVVDAALGCEAFPEDPSSVYRYPPP